MFGESSRDRRWASAAERALTWHVGLPHDDRDIRGARVLGSRGGGSCTRERGGAGSRWGIRAQGRGREGPGSRAAHRPGTGRAPGASRAPRFPSTPSRGTCPWPRAPCSCARSAWRNSRRGPAVLLTTARGQGARASAPAGRGGRAIGTFGAVGAAHLDGALAQEAPVGLNLRAVPEDERG